MRPKLSTSDEKEFIRKSRNKPGTTKAQATVSSITIDHEVSFT